MTDIQEEKPMKEFEERMSRHSFVKGQKIAIELTVEDVEKADYLMTWLYYPNEAPENYGCKASRIWNYKHPSEMIDKSKALLEEALRELSC